LSSRHAKERRSSASFVQTTGDASFVVDEAEHAAVAMTA
jgi:hypothetical protein